MFLNESVKTTARKRRRVPRVQATEAAMMNIIMESQEEFHNLITSMIRLEHTSIISENRKLMEAGVKNFFKKIWEALKKAWETVKGWFKAAFKWITELFQTVEGFLKKYRKTLANLNLKDYKAKVYGPVNAKRLEDVAAGAGGMANTYTKAIKNDEEPTAEDFQKFYLDHVLKGFKVDQNETFSEAVKRYCRGGAAEAKEQEIDQAMINKYVAYLEVSKSYTKFLKTHQKYIDGIYKLAIAYAQKGVTAKEMEDEDKRRELRIGAIAGQRAANVAQSAVSAAHSAHSSNIAEALRVCRGALANHAKNKGKSESVDILARFSL